MMDHEFSSRLLAAANLLRSRSFEPPVQLSEWEATFMAQLLTRAAYDIRRTEDMHKELDHLKRRGQE